MNKLQELESKVEEITYKQTSLGRKLFETNTELMLAKKKLNEHKAELESSPPQMGDIFTFKQKGFEDCKLIAARVSCAAEKIKLYALIIIEGRGAGELWSTPDSDINRIFGLQSRNEFTKQIK